MQILYSLLLTLAAAVCLPYFLIKGLRQGKYWHNLRERLGNLPPDVLQAAGGSSGAIWLHAVSVGELLAGLPLARALKEKYPQRKLFVSTTTDTGQRLAKERMTFADGVFYFPLDWAFAVRRVLRALRPAAVIVLETEIWPNFLLEVHRAGVPVLFVNGRVSERSFRRYRLGNSMFFGFLARVLRGASGILMQSESDAQRLREIGAPSEKVVVTGNLKFDLAPASETPLVQWLRRELARRKRGPVIVAGSVTAHEEPYVLIAFGTLQGQCRDAFLVLAPRKPERFDAAAAHIEESQRRYVRRSQVSLDAPLDENVGVLLLDSIGELAALYALADGVFVGGSLVAAGGHNILEPAAAGRVPIFGPHMENFQDIAAQFVAGGAAIQVHNPEDLGVAWIELWQNREKCERMGSAARALVEQSRGATAKTLARIAELLELKVSG
jgi:3-deoxy-D-manno-octulosonic-acid transferase